MHNQLYEYFDNIIFLSNVAPGEGIVLNIIFEKFKEAIYRGNEFGALLTDLSKTFDCINHPFLIAKLCSYGVSPLSINMTFFLFEQSDTSNQNQ